MIAQWYTVEHVITDTLGSANIGAILTLYEQRLSLFRHKIILS